MRSRGRRNMALSDLLAAPFIVSPLSRVGWTWMWWPRQNQVMPSPNMKSQDCSLYWLFRKKLSHKFLKKDWCFLNHQCMVRSEFPWVECTGAWFIWGWLKEIWNLPTHVSSCSVLYKVFFSCVCLISFTVSVLLMFSSSAISHDTNFVTFALHHGLQIINKYPRHMSYV